MMASKDNRNQISQVLASARGTPCCGNPPPPTPTRHKTTRLDSTRHEALESTVAGRTR